MELPEPRIVLRALDKRWYAAGEGGVRGHLGHVPDKYSDLLGRRAARELRHHVLVRGLERVCYQVEFVPPEPVDRGLAHMRTSCDRLDRECAVAQRGQLV